jgi:cell wall-associated protease
MKFQLTLTYVLTLSFLALTACDKAKMRNPGDYPESRKGYEKIDGPVESGDWYTKDPSQDKLEGVSSERATRDFDLKNEREIIVAVIDSGVDVNHEDLKGKIWSNPGETGVDESGNDKASNKIDDDKNGYIDDVHGWNFLGNPDGRNVEHDTIETTRELVRLEKLLERGQILSPKDQAYYEKVKAAYDEDKAGADEQLATMTPQEKDTTAAKALLKEKLGLEDYSQAALEAINSKDESIVKAKETLLEIIKTYRSVERFYRVLGNVKSTLDYYLNKSYNSREIVGDDPTDFSQTSYGNNDVLGIGADHGTHVSGIIAAIKDNGIGANGVAQNVKIMALRAVPNGDERDKDVALSVRYAVNNGAKIINMSFGKDFSPNKKQVDEAFLYAAEKGVLIVHAAGNASKNNDDIPSFPNRHVLDAADRKLPAVISTWIEVGASAKDKGLGLAAAFSNYGKKEVDIFAPGYMLNSTVPDNQYAVLSGTSMASPTAAGTAAFLMSNFKDMTAAQAKAILLKQSRQYLNLEVRLPGSAKYDLPVPFADLSATGGVIDAYTSIQLARQLSGQ